MKTLGFILIGLFLAVNGLEAQDTLYVYKGGVVIFEQVVTGVVIQPSCIYRDNVGNIFQTVTIGTQTWMAENLRTTKYRNGDPIPNVTNNASWSLLTTGAFCDYNTNAFNGTKFGNLYNWYAVNDPRNIAPIGWHIATDAEWTTLTTYVSTHFGTSLNTAKALAATTNWTTYATVGTVGNNPTINNYTGFSALPYGYHDGTFHIAGTNTNWWTVNASDANNAWSRRINNSSNTVIRAGILKSYGYSVRCVRDY